jgi:hypothetical protein
MSIAESRLDQELKRLRDMEQRYKEAFQKETLENPKFLRERVRNYDDALARVMASPVQEDKAAIRAFKLERDKLAKKAYPNLFRRLFEKLMDTFRAGNRIVKVQQANTDNANSLYETMKKAGLGDHYRQVEQQMKQGNREFSLPVSYQVSEHEKMELHLNFKKDDKGHYHFQKYTANLISDDTKIKPRQHTFDMQDAGYDTGKAYNLLSGRAVAYNQGSWKQLDFNDKDSEGNLRVKTFLPGYGFDLEKALSELPIKETERAGLLQKLKDGNLVETKLQINNKEIVYFLDANPQKKEVALYNQAGEKITPQQLKEELGQRKGIANVQQLVPKVSHVKEQSKAKSVKL